MGIEQVEVVIVGGGQAGLAMSYYLTEQGRTHLVLEQGRIAESWRSKRWDSLRLIAPNWTLRLPGFTYPGDDPDGFMSKDEVVAYLETYARSFAAPVREGVRVTAVAARPGRQRVPACGPRARPTRRPRSWWPPERSSGRSSRTARRTCRASVTQVVPPAYRNPRQLPPGAVLVVGSGETGCQIAEELRRAGRTVYLAVGRSWWAPRRYRGRDITFWIRPLGWFDRTVDDLPPGVRTGHPNPQLTGSDGGPTSTCARWRAEGVVLLGRLQGIRDGTVIFAPDLAANLAWGDEQALGLLRAIDDHIARQGLEAPAEAGP